MRNWLKGIIFECLKEHIKEMPLILSSRPPTEEDSYTTGTTWVSAKRKWICKKIKAEWEEIE